MTAALLPLGIHRDTNASEAERLRYARDNYELDIPLMLEAWNHGKGSDTCKAVALDMADQFNATRQIKERT